MAAALALAAAPRYDIEQREFLLASLIIRPARAIERSYTVTGGCCLLIQKLS